MKVEKIKFWTRVLEYCDVEKNKTGSKEIRHFVASEEQQATDHGEDFSSVIMTCMHLHRSLL